jgi:hypothetical protein
LAVLNDAIGDLRQSLGELRGAPNANAPQSLDQALRQLAGDPSFSSLLDIELALDLPSGETPSSVRSSPMPGVGYASSGLPGRDG